MSRSRIIGVLAIAVLGLGTIVSVATATRPCGARVCSDEVAAACSGLTRRAFHTCRRAVLRNCRTTDCTCDGSGTPCGAGTTTTTTAVTTTTLPGSPSAAFLE
jgi:hypothetical protein